MLKNIIKIAVGTLIFLAIPLILTLTGSGVDGVGFHWTLGDFIFAFVLIFGTGTLFELARKKAGKNMLYKIAAGMAFIGLFSLVWVNGAVGIIGDSDINAFYGIVALTIIIGTIIARLEPKKMSYTLYTAAFIQFFIPIVALILKEPDFSPGVVYVFILNAFWVTLFSGSAFFFEKAKDIFSSSPEKIS